MTIVRHPRPNAIETAIAIGSFDGVHLGHAAILERVVAEAKARAIEPAVLTFEPLPREFFTPEIAPARLTSLRERLSAIAATGIATTFLQRFDGEYASLTPWTFAERLRKRCGARWVMAGEDFRYGAQRAGDVASLEAAGRELGFDVEVRPQVCLGGERVSSTRVREALAQGDFEGARQLLGRPYAISGRVVRGAQRGRELGYPTANLRLGRHKPALQGIFAVKCYGAATRGLEGVASLGINPAVQSGGPATLEAFLFDFSGDLYGRHVTLEFLKKLRDEAYFASLDELTAQIALDCEAARTFFSALET